MKIEKLTSTDIVDENIQKLKQIFPTAFREGKVVMEELQALLGDYVEKEKEYYEMSWAGKSTARQEANKMSTGTLRPAEEESTDWEETENVFIEGDNLEVLKLLQKSYSDKVKMIYIDPPYNTGKDFVYKDNYKDNLSHYLELSGQTDDTGRRLSTNTESDGRYHSNWLNMMYPRLMLARNLLREDGVIFISIDDNEQANLKRLCDEIFGEENFVGSIAVLSNPRGRQSDKNLASVNDWIIVYSKKQNDVSLGGKPLSEKQKIDYKYIDESNQKRYRLLGLRQRGSASRREDRPDMFFPIYVDPNTLEVSLEEVVGWDIVLPKKSDNSEGRWMWGKAKCQKDLDLLEARLIAHRNEFDIFVKDFLEKAGKERTRKFTTNWTEKKYNNQNGTKEVKEILGGDYMSYPKPMGLIMDLIIFGSPLKDFLILDFFAGSGTTAHAVMQLNAEDGGRRKCLSVQLPEPTDEKSQAYQAGYSTIAEISKERIRRAGRQIMDDQEDEIRKKKENLEKSIGRELIRQQSDDGVRYEFPEGVLTDDSVMSALDDLNDHSEQLQKLDTGFRVFKLDSSNIMAWDTALDSFEGQLDAFAENDGEHIKRDRTQVDVLYEILLKYGLELTEPILEKECGRAKVYNIGYGSMYICLGDRIDSDVAVGIGEWHKEFSGAQPAVIFRDSGFPSDAAKTNVVQTLRQWGIDNVSSI